MLPWQNRDAGERRRPRRTAAEVYLRYLRRPGRLGGRGAAGDRPPDGATLVHCAAGKDRTGVVVALALAEVGVTREAIVADYAASAERIEAIFARLRGSTTYADDIDGSRRRPPAAGGDDGALLDAVDEALRRGVRPGCARTAGPTRTPPRCARPCSAQHREAAAEVHRPPPAVVRQVDPPAGVGQ